MVKELNSGVFGSDLRGALCLVLFVSQSLSLKILQFWLDLKISAYNSQINLKFDTLINHKI